MPLDLSWDIPIESRLARLWSGRRGIIEKRKAAGKASGTALQAYQVQMRKGGAGGACVLPVGKAGGIMSAVRARGKKKRAGQARIYGTEGCVD